MISRGDSDIWLLGILIGDNGQSIAETQPAEEVETKWKPRKGETAQLFDNGRAKYDLGRPAECRDAMTDVGGSTKWAITDGGPTGLYYKEAGTAIAVR